MKCIYSCNRDYYFPGNLGFFGEGIVKVPLDNIWIGRCALLQFSLPPSQSITPTYIWNIFRTLKKSRILRVLQCYNAYCQILLVPSFVLKHTVSSPLHGGVIKGNVQLLALFLFGRWRGDDIIEGQIGGSVCCNSLNCGLEKC